MPKILHFTPVRKPADVLELHLRSLIGINKENFSLTYSFFDDNVDEESSTILEQFVENNKNALLHQFDLEKASNYKGNERWVPQLYQRITLIKNKAIQYFLQHDFDYLFLSDADLIINPDCLKNLVSKQLDFCASVFWTHFKGNLTYTPNAWYAKHLGFSKEDLMRFKTPGTYEVDFTGACTLLSRNILEAGVSFEKISNIEFLGEDKHFCIRAAVLGFQAYLNTEYPCFHIYQQSNVQEGKPLLDNNFDFNLEDYLDENWEAKLDEMVTPKKKSILQRAKLRFRK
ncbi:hypothetical protein [Salegentibacter chungangensis]|uniref:Glycosyl transferase n=1 Tax=Salegentibacter chungangensis TaxID=1335724 RepID=A0ABW3NNY4_9FLAO